MKQEKTVVEVLDKYNVMCILEGIRKLQKLNLDLQKRIENLEREVENLDHYVAHHEMAIDNMNGRGE